MAEQQDMSVDDLPVILDPAELAMWFHRRGEPITAEEWNRAAARVGRNPATALLLFTNDLLAPDVLPGAVADAWQSAEFPLSFLTRADWLDLFGRAGYTVDGSPAPRPSEPQRLYRGCGVRLSRRWSWTPDRDLAQWFADRWPTLGEAAVFEVDASPSAMLATFTGTGDDARHGESEVVLNTKGLRIRRAGDRHD